MAGPDEERPYSVMQHDEGGVEVADWAEFGPWRMVCGPYETREEAIAAYQALVREAR